MAVALSGLVKANAERSARSRSAGGTSRNEAANAAASARSSQPRRGRGSGGAHAVPGPVATGARELVTRPSAPVSTAFLRFGSNSIHRCSSDMRSSRSVRKTHSSTRSSGAARTVETTVPRGRTSPPGTPRSGSCHRPPPTGSRFHTRARRGNDSRIVRSSGRKRSARIRAPQNRLASAAARARTSNESYWSVFDTSG